MTTTPDTHTSIAAEDAPIGVLLWSVRAPRYRRNSTLASVETHRDASSAWVKWTYESGMIRVFDMGQHVVVNLAATDGSR